MKRFLGLLIVSLFMASVAIAAGPKDYQVTGPVVDVKDDIITVKKGNENWEIARDKDTKATGEMKKGDKVTIKYKMTATSIQGKEAPKAKTDAKGEMGATGEKGAKGEMGATGENQRREESRKIGSRLQSDRGRWPSPPSHRIDLRPTVRRANFKIPS